MRVMSTAFFSQAEVTQVDRWDHGPLEIQLTPEPQDLGPLEFGALIYEWNSAQTAGFLRDGKNLETLQSMRLVVGKNPNLVIAPTYHGYSELLGMLGSLLPNDVLGRYGIERPEANFWLWPCSQDRRFRMIENVERYSDDQINHLLEDHLRRLATAIPTAFENWIWTRLVKSKRSSIRNFARNSSLRLLAGDVRFWMHRLYRVAIGLYESSPVVEEVDENWESLDKIRDQMHAVLTEEERGKFCLARPRRGGSLWEPDDVDEREWITELLIDGDTTVDSLEPVVDVLLGSATHEDFSERYSWIKEDFERAFYSKRSKLSVKLYEFIDNCPVHEGIDTPGYEDILFRDLMAFFDQRDRTIILALRQGKTQFEIAEQLGHSGHASVSRRVNHIKARITQLLRDD